MRNAFSVLLILISGLANAGLKSDIIESCADVQVDKKNSQVNACILYIDGFIDSSLQAKDAKLKTASNKADTSDYMQRIYRTRTFGRTDVNDKLADHNFCIPQEYDRKYVASQVAKSMDIKRLENVDLKQVLFDTLVANFPCNASSLARL